MSPKTCMLDMPWMGRLKGLDTSLQPSFFLTCDFFPRSFRRVELHSCLKIA